MSTDNSPKQSPFKRRYTEFRTAVANQPLIYNSIKRVQVLRANLQHRNNTVTTVGLSDHQDFRFYLAAFLRFKNEARCLPEWLCYHMVVGIEHFYLYNNNSDDNFEEVLAPFLQAGVVTLEHWPTKPASPTADLHCQERCKAETRWLACFDADEFLLPMTAQTIPEILRNFEQYPGLTANWHYFGSSGYEKRPNGLVMENYLRAENRLNRHVKSIINPRRAISYGNSHYWIYKGWQQAVDEDRREILGSFSLRPTGKQIRVNHYYTKSAEDYLAKCNPDWWVDRNSRTFPTHLKDKLEEVMAQHNDVEVTTILRFAEATRAKMAEFGFRAK